jgi:hypothetical protein
MSFLKQNYPIIRSFLLNGSYAYALYAIYALTITPFVIEVLEDHKHSWLIAIFGIIMLIAEFFALNFKLKMVRIRTQEKQQLYKQQSGRTTLPSVGPMVFFGLFIRLVFRTGIVMTIMTALGYDCNNRAMSIPGEIAILTVLFLDLIGFAYIYFKTDFYTDPPQTRKEFYKEIKENEDWYKANIEKASSLKYLKLEFLSDFILQIYALMLFSSFWEFMNQTAINELRQSSPDVNISERVAKAIQNGNITIHHINTTPGIVIFMLLFVTVMLGLMPIRIAYWIEDSLSAFTTKEKRVMWTLFAIAGIYTCSPFLVEYISITLFKFEKNSVPEYVRYLLMISFCLTLLLLQIFWIGKATPIKNEKTIHS